MRYHLNYRPIIVIYTYFRTETLISAIFCKYRCQGNRYKGVLLYFVHEVRVNSPYRFALTFRHIVDEHDEKKKTTGKDTKKNEKGEDTKNSKKKDTKKSKKEDTKKRKREDDEDDDDE